MDIYFVEMETFVCPDCWQDFEENPKKCNCGCDHINESGPCLRFLNVTIPVEFKSGKYTTDDFLSTLEISLRNERELCLDDIFDFLYLKRNYELAAYNNDNNEKIPHEISEQLNSFSSELKLFAQTFPSFMNFLREIRSYRFLSSTQKERVEIFVNKKQ